MSPDVIERCVIVNGKEKWAIYICPVGTSRHDDIAHQIIKNLE